MTSIITAIYNQLAMNKLYYESICRTTDNEWELIIIDNGSTDGSVEYFEAQPHTQVIRNDGNYSYPYCQNVGIQKAQGEILAFLNNDILLSPHWDSRIQQVLGHNNNEILSLASNDRMPNAHLTKQSTRRWKHIKNLFLHTLGSTDYSLQRMVKWYYGNWNKYCQKLWDRYGTRLRLGFSGSAILMTRKGLSLIGGQWDPTQQGADYDLFLQTQQLYQTGYELRPMSIVCGVYHHHYCRLTLHSSYPPYKDQNNLRTCEQKWGDEVVQQAIRVLRHPMPSISYAITVCNESSDLDRLLTHIEPYLQIGDEIVVQADQNHVTPEVKAVIAKHKHFIAQYVEHPLNYDFAQAKNHLNNLCSCDYIFQLDADEMPQPWLMEHLKEIIIHKPWVGLFKLPRINLFQSQPDGEIEERVAWPDYQGRVYKNTPRISWRRPLHERIHGHWFYWHLPKEDKFAIVHLKLKQQDADKWKEWKQHY